MIIAVGSTNPTKIKPVEEVFNNYFGNVEVIGTAVDSGVSEQPMSDDEAYRGALSRATQAIKSVKDADYGVGVEGGLRKTSYGWIENSMVVIIDTKGKVGIGNSAGIVLPESIIALIQKGATLEEAIDTLCGTEKIGEGIGMFGVMTNEYVTRAEGVRHGVAFALARFLHPEMYVK